MLNDIKRVLFSREEIDKMCRKLGERISRDYENKNLLVVCVLKGAAVFTADLMRYITIPCKLDFISVSSYGAGTVSSEKIELKKDLDTDPQGYDLLLIEDILDSGRTLHYVINDILKKKNPADIKICALLDKPSRRVMPDIKAEYYAAEVPDVFVVGYGLDFNEKYRNLPFIGELKEEIYK